MNDIDYEQFGAKARANGFDEVLERSWEPNRVVESHAHAFSASARVVPHAERYGSEGASNWVARRNGG